MERRGRQEGRERKLTGGREAGLGVMCLCMYAPCECMFVYSVNVGAHAVYLFMHTLTQMNKRYF